MTHHCGTLLCFIAGKLSTFRVQNVHKKSFRVACCLVRQILNSNLECLISPNMFADMVLGWKDMSENFSLKRTLAIHFSMGLEFKFLPYSWQSPIYKQTTIFEWTSRNQQAQIFWSQLICNEPFGQKLLILWLAVVGSRRKHSKLRLGQNLFRVPFFFL